MVSSLSRFRHRLKPNPDKVSACVYDENERDTTRDEKFPVFTADLYFSVFPPPIKDRRVDDDRETDYSKYMEYMHHLGSGRLGEYFTVQRNDLNPYPSSIVPKKDPKLVVALMKSEASKVDYVDAVRAIEPFTLRGKHISPFIGKILLSFRSRLPYIKEYYYMVCEYWSTAVSLCKHLQQVGPLPEKEARFYLVELADVLSCIHRYGKILRRLSICNMIIEPDGHIKLTPYTMCDQNLDCGQSCNMLVKNCGDQFYAAPEVVFGVDVQFAADWWSFGVIAYQLLTGTLPFRGKTLGDLGKAITECAVQIPDCVSGEAAAMIKHLLHKDPRRRLGFNEVGNPTEQGSLDVKNHPFFHNVLWPDVTKYLNSPPFRPKEIPPPTGLVFKDKVKAAHDKKTSKVTQ